MATKIKWRQKATDGFTLLELLVVITLISVFTAIAVLGRQQMTQEWQLRQAGHQLFEDLKALQSEAELSGSMAISDGLLQVQRRFLVFDRDTNSYEAYLWHDENGNGVAEEGEAAFQWSNDLPSGISYAWGAGIERRACSNVNNPPNNAVSFASPNYSPCYDRPCIKFDHNGFSVMGPGAIYLSNGQQSLAITATRTGHFTMCEWDGERWR